MKKVSWRESAEVIGISAIVASLIFVGLQLKQSQEIAVANQYQSRAEATMSFFSTHIEAEYIIPMFKDLVTDTYTVQDVSAGLWYWVAFDNHYFQYQSGFLAEGAWQGQLRSMKRFYSNCLTHPLYERRKIAFRPELVALVDSWDDSC